MDSPSRFRSLRWQLPLSYAAIALLAVLALGITLLGTLRSFYLSQEIDYLAGNAAAIAEEVAPLLAENERPFLQAQIDVFSFLTQTRVQILDPGGQTILADSGELSGVIPNFFVDPEGVGLLDNLGLGEDEVTIVIEEEQNFSGGNISSQRVVTRTSRLSAEGSLFGFNLVQSPTAVNERSDIVQETTIMNESGEPVGLLRLSQGPAYGSLILQGVALGWVIAGLIAVIVAALIGWWVSRRVTQPLLDLTAVTGQMTQGDLSARAGVQQKNELGTLGHSFNQMADQVENTVVTLRHFVADAAHELHTPLTALQTDLQLLNDTADPQQQQRLARAQEQALRMQSLADNLLDLSRLEAEAALGERPLLNLNQLLQKIAEPVASQAEQAGLEFELNLPEPAVFVHSDEARLQQALSNLLDNSLKFTPPPGNIWLDLEEKGQTVIITVRDTGIGIPPEDLPKLFGRFHRGTNTANYPGSGLGLAIVKAIVTGHGGDVTIENENKGIKAQLRLPSASSSNPNL